MGYPRDLRFNKIVDFKRGLAQKVKATYQAAENDSFYTTFLKHFGTFSVANLETKEVSKEDYIIEEMQELHRGLARIEAGQRQTAHARETMPVCFQSDKKAVREAVAEVIKAMQDEGHLDLPDMEDEVISRVYRRLHHGLLTRRSGELDDMIQEALYS